MSVAAGRWVMVASVAVPFWNLGRACMEAVGGEGALGDAVLHSPLRIERLVDFVGR